MINAAPWRSPQAQVAVLAYSLESESCMTSDELTRAITNIGQGSESHYAESYMRARFWLSASTLTDRSLSRLFQLKFCGGAHMDARGNCHRPIESVACSYEGLLKTGSSRIMHALATCRGVTIATLQWLAAKCHARDWMPSASAS